MSDQLAIDFGHVVEAVFYARTDAEKAEIIAQYNKGYGIPAKAIAVTMSAHISSITYILSHAGVYIPTRTKGTK